MPVINANPGDNLQALINSCNNPGPLNQYDIILAPGDYNQTPFITVHGSISGILTRDYVHLRGATADRSLYRIKLERPNGANYAGDYELFSFRTNTELENLTITCRNGRYPIHFDMYNSNIHGKIINCHVQNYGNYNADGTRYATYLEVYWISPHGVGLSFKSGCQLDIIDSTIIGCGLGGPLGGHNNPSNTAPAVLNISNTILQHNEDGPSILISSMGSGQADVMNIINGSTLTGPIVYEDAAGLAVGQYNEWHINTDGTNTFPESKPAFVYHMVSTTEQYRPIMPEVQAQATNTSGVTIPQGAACFAVGAGSVRLMTSADLASKFAGFAVNAIASGDTGYLYEGYCTEKETWDSGTLAAGSKLALDAGQAGHLVVSGAGIANIIGTWQWYHDYLAQCNWFDSRITVEDVYIINALVDKIINAAFITPSLDVGIAISVPTVRAIGQSDSYEPPTLQVALSVGLPAVATIGATSNTIRSPNGANVEFKDIHGNAVIFKTKTASEWQ